MQTILILLVLALLIFLIFFSIAALTKEKDLKNKHKATEKKEKIKGFTNKMNDSDLVYKFSEKMPSNNDELTKIFNKAKNPWRMTIATFQFIRFFGLIIGLILAGFLLLFGFEYAIIGLAVGVLSMWYPMYYYKAIGNEREAEWNKSYEFIWVIKHNIMLYDPAKSFMNVKMYIEKHAEHNKEIIQGFDDFYKYWNAEYIDPYITKFYPFSVTREIYQIIFNMHKTGEFPEDSLNALRIFIINSQNLTVERTLSSVSGKATIFSLPFLMISVIVALMIPLIFQIVKFF